jgi:CRP-like cAMP-binding protein
MIVIMSASFAATLRPLASRSRRLAADAHLFHRGDPVSHLFLVVEGRIDLLRFAEDGSRLVLQHAGPDDILAEASVFSPRYHCDAIATAPCVVASISRQRFRDRLRGDPHFAEAWEQHLAQEIQALRLRSEILSLRTVAARLDAWLAWHGDAPPRGAWKHLADQIGVSPEALYRELARRRT